MRLWDVQTGQPKKTFIGETDYYKVIEVNEDGVRKVKSYASKRVESIAFSPDGKTLACAGSNGAIALLDMSTLQVKKSFSGHAAWVNSVAFSPDGRTLASGSEDGTILIWELDP